MAGEELLGAREGGGKTICAVYAHNDDMMVGAIQAMKEAGLKPGKDILTVSIDAVPDIFKAIEDRVRRELGMTREAVEVAVV